MNVLTNGPHLSDPLEGRGVSDDSVRTQVWSILGSLYPRGSLVERRRERRYPFPYLVHLTPVDSDGVTPHGEALVVVGKDLSDTGIGFYHPKPISQRRMIASIEISGGQSLSFLVDLTWCRFTKQGWYESGGRFLQTVSSPARE